MATRWTRRQALQHGALACAGAWMAPRGWAQPAGATEAAVVMTPSGRVRGEESNGVRVFRGLPFAEPPVGDLRFRPPLPKKAWAGVLDATHFAAAPMQQGGGDVKQSEDCLYLNVWTPKLDRGAASCPVFVWIHGGGFTGGESFAKIFDGTVFARQGIVIVTVAYRLGVLGFLDVEPLLGSAYAGSANNALRDLLLGLEWVRTHIGAFGGDPGRVTVGGESAGAKLTDILAGVPQARGLFHGMISESGGAERIWPKDVAQTVTGGFGKIWTQTSGASVQQLRSALAEQLIEAQTRFLKGWPQHFPLRCELDGGLLAEPPLHALAAGSAKGKRLLIGTNRDESALFLGAHPDQDPTGADLGNMNLAAFEAVYARYAATYPEMTAEQRRIRAVTAEEYWVPSTRVADAVANSGAQVWAYELDFARTTGAYKGMAFHSEDLGLVWDKPSREGESAGAEASLASQMNAAWAAFLRGEAPGAPGLPFWPEYNAQTRATMRLDRTSRIEQHPQGAELALWQAFEPIR